MGRQYHLRVENTPAHVDYRVNASSLEDARARLAARLPLIKQWDWRGAVAFVDGTRPAEETKRTRSANVARGTYATLRLRSGK